MPYILVQAIFVTYPWLLPVVEKVWSMAEVAAGREFFPQLIGGWVLW